MITKTIPCLIFCTLLSLTWGCATIFKGAKSTVGFGSNPEGAKVFVDGMPRGTTPLTLKLDSNKEYNIRFEKAGHSSAEYHLGREMGAGWIVLDILGGGIPILVDALTGSWYKLDEETINVTLASN